MQGRTDLALESEQRAGASGKLEGVIKRERRCEDTGLTVTEIEITTQEAAGLIGRPIGHYVTLSLDSGRFSDRAGAMAAPAITVRREMERTVAVSFPPLFLVFINAEYKLYQAF